MKYITVTVEGQKQKIEEIVLELRQLKEVDELSTSAPSTVAEDRILTRKPHGYVEIIEVVISIATSLGSAFVYDFLKSKGVKVKKDDTDSKEKSQLDDQDDTKS